MPLLFDMPLDELKTYAGINPCPSDFDDFWDQSTREMQALDPQVELIPADFQASFAKCFDLYFTGVGGARIHAKLLKPVNADNPHPAILQFHGYSGHAGNWVDKLPYVAAGYTVAALDCRGQGGFSEDPGDTFGSTFQGHIVRGVGGPPEKMLFRNIFLDTAQLAKIIMDMPDVDSSRVAVNGGSQGGGLSLACAALEPGIKLVAPIFPFLSDYQRVWEMDLAVDAYAGLTQYFRWYDPTHEREEAVFTQMGYIDVQHLCPRIRGEVLMAVGLMDKICPPSTQFAAYNKINAPKSMTIYPDFGHEPLLVRHHADRIFQFMDKL